ncbi:MAG TPA: lytic transglycosylase domain-containing protein [Acidobacteriota bacterium]
MRVNFAVKGLLLLIVLLAATQSVPARSVHSYLDETGVLIYFTVTQKHTDIDGIPVAVIDPPPMPGAKPAGGATPYDGFISKHAGIHGVDPDLVRAVMATESGYNPIAVSNKGAIGLMQLIPSTAKRFGVRDIFDPEQNVEGGVKYLRFLLDLFNNDLKLTLGAYNAGENVVKRLGAIPNYRETTSYVKRITTRYGDNYRNPGAPAAVQPIQQQVPTQRVYRMVDASGNILFTNRPTTD